MPVILSGIARAAIDGSGFPPHVRESIEQAANELVYVPAEVRAEQRTTFHDIDCFYSSSVFQAAGRAHVATFLVYDVPVPDLYILDIIFTGGH